MPKIVSIISDWKNQDFYLAALKHRLMRYMPDVVISDVSHQIEPFNTMQSAFVMRAAWRYFPENSIHLMCVNAAASAKTPHVLLKHRNHYFIGADNGYWPFILGENPDNAWIINDEMYYEGNSFPELNVFAALAAGIGNGMSPDELGKPAYEVNENTELKVVFKPGSIHAAFLYFDSYGNGMSNLTKQMFYEHVGDKKIRILVVSEQNKLNKINTSYADVRQGSLCAVFNSQDLLELAIREGNLKQLLDLQIGDTVRIEYW
ncbi:MAG: SAM-dependent chlorinase/fluorinase [Candidatus Delongbacteria bacterium]|jgi:S-adenosylmethionine hydrolase|nr:SAM-dependent chlorinase/fluorinase [Candidatus Delongbacteria bacterium]